MYGLYSHACQWGHFLLHIQFPIKWDECLLFTPYTAAGYRQNMTEQHVLIRNLQATRSHSQPAKYGSLVGGHESFNNLIKICNVHFQNTAFHFTFRLLMTWILINV